MWAVVQPTGSSVVFYGTAETIDEAAALLARVIASLVACGAPPKDYAGIQIAEQNTMPLRAP